MKNIYFGRLNLYCIIISLTVIFHIKPASVMQKKAEARDNVVVVSCLPDDINWLILKYLVRKTSLLPILHYECTISRELIAKEQTQAMSEFNKPFNPASWTIRQGGLKATWKNDGSLNFLKVNFDGVSTRTFFDVDRGRPIGFGFAEDSLIVILTNRGVMFLYDLVKRTRYEIVSLIHIFEEAGFRLWRGFQFCSLKMIPINERPLDHKTSIFYVEAMWFSKKEILKVTLTGRVPKLEGIGDLKNSEKLAMSLYTKRFLNSLAIVMNKNYSASNLPWPCNDIDTIDNLAMTKKDVETCLNQLQKNIGVTIVPTTRLRSAMRICCSIGVFSIIILSWFLPYFIPGDLLQIGSFPR